LGAEKTGEGPYIRHYGKGGLARVGRGLKERGKGHQKGGGKTISCSIAQGNPKWGRASRSFLLGQSCWWGAQLTRLEKTETRRALFEEKGTKNRTKKRSIYGRGIARTYRTRYIRG